MVHWFTCWHTHVCQKLAHLDVGISAQGHLYPKMPSRSWTSTCFFLIGIFWRLNYEIFEISRVSYFLWKLGTKVKQCALILSVFDYFLIFRGPTKFWPKRRRRPLMLRDWIFQKWHHIHDKTTYWDAENDFCKKSWGCHHIAVVQNWPSFGSFGRQLTRHKMDAQANSKFNHMLKSPPKVP